MTTRVALVTGGTGGIGTAIVRWPGPILIATLALSWVFTNLVFMLHYAHMFYAARPDGTHGVVSASIAREASSLVRSFVDSMSRPRRLAR